MESLSFAIILISVIEDFLLVNLSYGEFFVRLAVTNLFLQSTLLRSFPVQSLISLRERMNFENGN